MLSPSVTREYNSAVNSTVAPEYACSVSRTGLARWIKDPFCGLSHAIGALLALAGLFALLELSWGTTWEIVAVSIYGTSMVLLYTASALAHSLHCSPELAWRLDQFDYMAIFVMIAGTYTPICLGPLWGPWGWTLLSVEWCLAGVGIVSVLMMKQRAGWLRIGVYFLMGWLVFLATGQLTETMSATAWAWLIAGGVCYSVGAIVFVTQRPLLWPGRFDYHDLWHVLALSGSACHFFLVRTFVV